MPLKSSGGGGAAGDKVYSFFSSGAWASTFGNVRYSSMAYLSTGTARANKENKFCACTAKKIKLYVTTNTSDGEVIVGLMIGGVLSALHVHVGVGAVNQWFAATSDVAVADDDLLCFSMDATAAGSGTVTVTAITVDFSN